MARRPRIARQGNVSTRATTSRRSKAQSTVRPTIVGQDIQYPPGTSLRKTVNGYSFGAYGTVVLPGDVAQVIADGCNIVRVVSNFRWDGGYGTPGTDSRDDTAFARFSARNWALLKDIVRQLTNAGIWVVVTFDSDYRINANGGTGVGTTGDNIWTNGTTFGYVREIWKMAAREFRSYPYIFAYELTAEPMADKVAFDATWSAVLKDRYRTLIDDIRQYDKLAPFVLGGRGGYDTTTMAEVILSERTDCIYTFNRLSNGLIDIAGTPGALDVVCTAAQSANVPLFCNQMGSQSTDDPNDYALRSGWMAVKARGIITTWWQVKDKGLTANQYGWRYSDGGSGFIDKTARINNSKDVMARTLASMESAAQAAATAAGAVLFYVKPDLSNVFQDSAGTTPVTAAGQPIGLVNPVVGAGLTLGQATALNRPTLGAAALSYLIDQRPVINFDGVNGILFGSGVYYASGDDMTVIAAGIPANSGTIQTFVHAGSSTGSTHYPRLAAAATKKAQAQWTGDDLVARQITGTTSTASFPCVLSATKAGTDKKLFVNGIQEGATDSNAVGAIATMARLRVGGTTTNNPNYIGSIALVCLCKGGMTDTQRQAIERFAAYLVGAPYQL